MISEQAAISDTLARPGGRGGRQTDQGNHDPTGWVEGNMKIVTDCRVGIGPIKELVLEIRSEHGVDVDVIPLTRLPDDFRIVFQMARRVSA